MARNEAIEAGQLLVLSLFLVGSVAVLTLLPAPTHGVADSPDLVLNDSTTGAENVEHTWSVSFSTFEGSDNMDRIELDYSNASLNIDENPSSSSFTVLAIETVIPVESVSVNNDVVTLNVSGATIPSTGTVDIITGPIFGNPSEVGTYDASIQFFGATNTSAVGTAEFSVGTGVAGVVEDGTGEPLENVTVEAAGTTDVTDENGEYGIELAEGTYDVRFEKDGYVTVTHRDVNVAAGEVASADLTGRHALAGTTTVNSLTLSDTSRGANGVTYSVSFSPDNPITDISYITVNLSRASDVSLDAVGEGDISVQIDGENKFDGLYSSGTDNLTIVTTTPVTLDEASTVDISIDGVTNPSTGGEYPFLVELREDYEGFPYFSKSFASEQFEIASPSGEITLADDINAPQDQFDISYAFDSMDYAGIVVRNLRTGEAYRQRVSEPGSRQVNVTALGGIQEGDELVAEIYESADLVTRLGNDSATVKAPAPAGELTLSPPTLAFSRTTVGDEETKVISVTNTGNDRLAVNDVRIEGADAFVASGTTFSLEVGETMELLVRFAPDSAGTFEASAVFEDSAGRQRATLPLEGAAVERPSSQPVPPSEDDGDDGGDSDDGDSDDGEDEEDEDEEDEPVIETESESTESGASVDSSVENARAGEQISIEVPDPAEDQAFEIDSVGFTPAENRTFDLSIETSSEPLDGTPDAAFAFDRTTELGYLSVESTLENDAIEETEFTFRVSEDRLDDWESDPEDVAMYRHDEATDTWVEHDTEFVGREDGDILLRARGDGFSEWTAAAKRPALNITDTEIDVDVATTEEDVTIQVFVRNTGGADGTYEAQLLANGETLDREDATVPANRTVIIDFIRTFDQPDRYEVQVNDVPVGQINITEDEEVTVDATDDTPDDSSDSTPDDSSDSTPDDSSDDSSDDTPDESDGGDADSSTAPTDATPEAEDGDGGVLDGFGPGFGVGTALVAALLGGALYARRRDAG